MENQTENQMENQMEYARKSRKDSQIKNGSSNQSFSSIS